MENNDIEKNNDLEDFNDLEGVDNSESLNIDQNDIKEGFSVNQETASLKKSNKDIRVYTMPEEFFNKKYQISRAKRLVEIKKEQGIMEIKRIAEERKRMKQIEIENEKIEKEKRKRIQVETLNAEKLKKEYEKRQKLIEKNRKIREEKLKIEKEKESEELKKKQELVLKELEEKKIKEIKKENTKEKEIKKDIDSLKETIKSEDILENPVRNNENPKNNNITLGEKIRSKFNTKRKRNFSDYFNDTIDGDDVNSDIKNKIDRKVIDSIGDINQINKKNKNKKESNILFIFISIIVFVISVIITIFITYRNGEWFYYEEEINIDNNNNTIYWNNLIEDEDSVGNNNVLLYKENNEEGIENQNENLKTEIQEENSNLDDLGESEDEIFNESQNNPENNKDFSYYYEKCDFFITNSNFPVSSDSDFDCLTDKEEIVYGTLNNNSDSDSDSYIDGLEVSYVYDPLTSGKIYNNNNLKEYKDELNKFSFYYPKAFEFRTIDNSIFRIIPEKNSEEYFEVEFLGSFDLSSLGRITRSSGIKQIDAWVSDSSDYVYIELSNGDILRFYYNFENVDSLNYQASFSLIVRSVYIW